MSTLWPLHRSVALLGDSRRDARDEEGDLRLGAAVEKDAEHVVAEVGEAQPVEDHARVDQKVGGECASG